jgi:peroxiredoxin
MKKFIKPLLTGIVATLVMVLVMLKVTMDFQLLLFIGAVIFFIAGLINSDTRIHYLLATFIITIIYLLLFIILVLEQLPLWYFVPIYFAIALLGILYKRHKQKIITSLLLLTALMFFLAIKIIPTDLENSLTQTRFEQIPQFSIKEMSGNVVDSKTLEGKVVILDFFGTWCKPCIGELKELDKIQMTFKDDKDVVFYVINADYGNDSPEKFKTFIDKHNYKFKFAYDYDSKIFKLFKLQKLGIPVTLIIDKEQNIRLQHVGYNPAETNFSENMIKTINSLK